MKKLTITITSLIFFGTIIVILMVIVKPVNRSNCFLETVLYDTITSESKLVFISTSENKQLIMPASLDVQGSITYDSCTNSVIRITVKRTLGNRILYVENYP